MSLKHALSLLIVALGLVTAGSSSADTFREGYICSLADFGTTQAFTITSNAHCGGYWSGWLFFPTTSPVFAGQFDRLQQALYQQRPLFIAFDPAGTPLLFSYN